MAKPLFLLNSLLLGAVSSVYGEATLFNGLQSTIFPTNTTTECLNIFNTTLNCDPKVRLLYKQTDWASWNQSDLTTLCTQDCRNSLTTLAAAAEETCGSQILTTFGFNASTMMDFYFYKYNMTCLADGDSFCLMEQGLWFLEHLDTVTWPIHTNKTYPDWNYDPVNGTNQVLEDGSTIVPYRTYPLPSPTWNPTTSAALDYIFVGTPRPTGSLYETPNDTYVEDILEYDEYPLEIQCSTCFVERFKLGFASQWGERYDDTKGQVWENMKLNCELDGDLVVHPDIDSSGPPRADRAPVIWNTPSLCERNLTLSTPWGSATNCTTFALQNNLPSASIPNLNSVYSCRSMDNGTYCAPLPCQVAEVDEFVTAYDLIQGNGTYSNISLTQFMRWNPSANLRNIEPGEVICIGPPGGAYVPKSTTVEPANPTSFTTTATPAAPTSNGTIANCGLYYTVGKKDDCSTVSLQFGITLAEFLAMNTQVDEACTNLWLGYAYCVAAVVNSTASTTTAITSSKPTTTPPTTAPPTTTVPATTTTSFATAPAPTQSGATSECSEWYVAQSGDGCWAIQQTYGITAEQFQAWNPIIDDDCTTLWPDYAYCVAGSAV